DAELEVRRALVGRFEPVSLSVDEAGWIYLLADEGDRRALWVVTPEGERTARFELPPPLHTASAPPAVGYNHVAYIPRGARILAVGGRGELLWIRPTRADSAGCAVTMDGELLVTDETALVTFDRDGDRWVVWDSGGNVLRASPTLTPDGHVLMVSDRAIH